MEKTLGIVLAALLLTCVQAYLTGEPCKDLNNRFALRWTQCSLCSAQNCRCVFAGGKIQADCERVAARSIFPGPGCFIGDNIVEGNTVTCCPISCPPSPLEETCTSSFGAEFSVGQRWEECIPGSGCCFNSCECVRKNGRVEPECFQACPRIVLQPGCKIIESFQNATHKDCCRTQCEATAPPPVEQCSTSFGVNYNEGDSWEECSPGSNCCEKQCDCLRKDGRLQPVCHERCKLLKLRAGCRIIESFQNATYKDCCRTECTEPESCQSSIGQRFLEGQTWTECSLGRSCCFESCTCARQGGVLKPECFTACHGQQLASGCRIIDPIQTATHTDCCRTQCP